MPQDEKDKAMKVCAEIEQAYWFYLDFLRPEDPSLLVDAHIKSL